MSDYLLSTYYLPGTFYTKGQQTFSLKGQTVNILGFAGPRTVSAAAECSTKAATDNMKANGGPCSPKADSQKKAWGHIESMGCSLLTSVLVNKGHTVSIAWSLLSSRGACTVSQGNKFILQLPLRTEVS